MKYEVLWQESRVYRCWTVIEADSEEEAKTIAAHPFCEGSREWTDEEHAVYVESLQSVEGEILNATDVTKYFVVYLDHLTREPIYVEAKNFKHAEELFHFYVGNHDGPVKITTK